MRSAQGTAIDAANAQNEIRRLNAVIDAHRAAMEAPESARRVIGNAVAKAEAKKLVDDIQAENTAMLAAATEMTERLVAAKAAMAVANGDDVRRVVDRGGPMGTDAAGEWRVIRRLVGIEPQPSGHSPCRTGYTRLPVEDNALNRAICGPRSACS